ncbi:MAG: hypothetical protein JW751_23100 [Polyangiaceae bacterium]|nr:hypothetical protein [Polyangiaceae bacterium]
MSVSSRVVVLEELLSRVRRNAARPRRAPLDAPTAALGAVPAAAEVAPLAAARAAALAPLRSEPPEVVEDFDLITEPPPRPATFPPSPNQQVAEDATPSGIIALEGELMGDADLELDEGELIDVTDLSPEEVASIEAEAAEIEVAEGSEAEGEEPVPSSSPRAKITAASMDEALASAATELGEDLECEVPLHTPPPQSGRQVAAPVHLPAQGEPPRDLLEVEPELPVREFSEGPTPEQLGETIELDEPLGGDLELERLSELATSPPPRDELEHELPYGAPGAYDTNLELPPGAREDLERHRIGDALRGRRPEAIPAEVVPVVVERPPLHAHPAEITGERPRIAPPSFLAALDASLAL